MNSKRAFAQCFRDNHAWALDFRRRARARQVEAQRVKAERDLERYQNRWLLICLGASLVPGVLIVGALVLT